MSEIRQENSMVVGIKQTLRMVERDCISELFIAKDADFYVTKPILEVARENRVPIRYVESKKKLGHLCGIDIGAAVAGRVKDVQAQI
jgi:large subunit ribosomal protein L7A